MFMQLFQNTHINRYISLVIIDILIYTIYVDIVINLNKNKSHILQRQLEHAHGNVYLSDMFYVSRQKQIFK